MQDRVPLYPGRVTLTPVSGQANTFDLVRADQPTQEGTPLNKASLLKDATAALFGKTNAAVPDDILSLLSKSMMAEVTEKYTKQTKTLAQYSTGSIVHLKERGVDVEFYVAKHNYESGLNGTGRTLLVRKEPVTMSAFGNTNAYAGQSLDSSMTSYVANRFDDATKNAIGKTTFHYTPGNGSYSITTLQRTAFALSLTELGRSDPNANAEGSTLPIASILQVAKLNGTAVEQSTRTPNTNSSVTVFFISSSGVAYETTSTTSKYYRPAFTLPETFEFVYYTDSAGNIYTEQEYETKITDVLGNLISIPVDQIKDGVKIATGSYTGTGTYGSSNPNSLTFEFEPKIIYIKETDYRDNIPTGGFIWVNPSTDGISYYGGGGSPNAWGHVVITWGKTVTWYNENSYLYQINQGNTSYTYFAIG